MVGFWASHGFCDSLDGGVLGVVVAVDDNCGQSAKGRGGGDWMVLALGGVERFGLVALGGVRRQRAAVEWDGSATVGEAPWDGLGFGQSAQWWLSRR